MSRFLKCKALTNVINTANAKERRKIKQERVYLNSWKMAKSHRKSEAGELSAVNKMGELNNGWESCALQFPSTPTAFCWKKKSIILSSKKEPNCVSLKRKVFSAGRKIKKRKAFWACSWSKRNLFHRSRYFPTTSSFLVYLEMYYSFSSIL